jgi:hypothetical protein
MIFLIYYNNHVCAFNPNKKKRKNLLHVDCDHVIIVKKLEEEVNALVVRGPFERQLAKIKINISKNVISKFFFVKDLF